MSLLLSIYLQLVNGFHGCSEILDHYAEENNINSNICVREKRHMDMAWKQQLLLDSLLGKRAHTRKV